ncbi:MAG TPA: ABC transporter substrate-binding protein [Candidatus Paceibacterota bacterium]|nr:ABC transporter substrate-binding protein [Candidatus Paceibacterota bacterium]
MKISLFQGVLLGVFGLAALVGLIVFATYTAGPGKNGVGAVVIWGTFPQQEMQAALTAAVKNDQSLKSVTYVQKDAATFDQGLVSAIAAGQSPDLVILSQEDLQTLASALAPIPAASLSAATFAADFTAGASIWQIPGGGTYGVPFLIDPLILFANEPLLSSAGIAQIPSTWEAMTGLVPKLALSGKNNALSQELIALGTYGNVTDARAILSALFFQAGVPLAARQTSGAIAADLGLSAQDNGTPAGEAVLRFYTQFADPSKVSYTWNASLPPSIQAFAAGDTALYLGYASEAAYLAAANPNLAFAPAPLPQPADASVKATYGRIYAFAIPRGAGNPSGALAAAGALVSAANDAAAAGATGLAPALRSLLSAPPADPLGAAAYAAALYARGWLSPAPAATDQIFSSMIGSVDSGQLDISAALGNAQSALNALLQ